MRQGFFTRPPSNAASARFLVPAKAMNLSIPAPPQKRHRLYFSVPLLQKRDALLAFVLVDVLHKSGEPCSAKFRAGLKVWRGATHGQCVAVEVRSSPLADQKGESGSAATKCRTETALDCEPPFVEAVEIPITNKQRTNCICVKDDLMSPRHAHSKVSGLIEKVTEESQAAWRRQDEFVRSTRNGPLHQIGANVPATQVHSVLLQPLPDIRADGASRRHAPSQALFRSSLSRHVPQIASVDAIHGQRFRDVDDGR